MSTFVKEKQNDPTGSIAVIKLEDVDSNDTPPLSGGRSVLAGRWRKVWISLITVAGVIVGAALVGNQVYLHRQLQSARRAASQSRADFDAGVAPTQSLDDENVESELVLEMGQIRKLTMTTSTTDSTLINTMPWDRRRGQAKCSRFTKAGFAKKEFDAGVNCFYKVFSSGCSSSCVVSIDDTKWFPKYKVWGVNCYCGNAGKYDVDPLR
jgi:hypothetical protein